MDKILYLDIHDILGQFPNQEIPEKIKQLNKDIKLSSDKFIKSNIPIVSFVNDDVKMVQKYFYLKIGYSWIIRKHCIDVNEKDELDIIFVSEHEYIPEQIFNLNVELILKGLNIGKNNDDPDFWVACNSKFLYYFTSDTSKSSDNNILFKLKNKHYWIVKNSAMLKSKEYNSNKIIMKDINQLISLKAYKNE